MVSLTAQHDCESYNNKSHGLMTSVIYSYLDGKL